jgi:hypothetical protein
MPSNEAVFFFLLGITVTHAGYGVSFLIKRALQARKAKRP